MLGKNLLFHNLCSEQDPPGNCSMRWFKYDELIIECLLSLHTQAVVTMAQIIGD